MYSIEILKPLAESAQKRLANTDYKNITIRCGDGYRGWPKKAPFEVLIVAAAPDHVPEPLVDQLARGGRLVIPVGQFFQELLGRKVGFICGLRGETRAASLATPSKGRKRASPPAWQPLISDRVHARQWLAQPPPFARSFPGKLSISPRRILEWALKTRCIDCLAACGIVAIDTC